MSAQPKVSLDHERAKLSRTTILAIVVDSDGEGRWQALGVQDSDGIVAAVDPVLETDRGEPDRSERGSRNADVTPSER